MRRLSAKVVAFAKSTKNRLGRRGRIKKYRRLAEQHPVLFDEPANQGTIKRQKALLDALNDELYVSISKYISTPEHGSGRIGVRKAVGKKLITIIEDCLNLRTAMKLNSQVRKGKQLNLTKERAVALADEYEKKMFELKVFPVFLQAKINSLPPISNSKTELVFRELLHVYRTERIIIMDKLNDTVEALRRL